VKDQYIITSVVFKLTKRDHKINTSYGDITNELAKNNITNPSLKDAMLLLPFDKANYPTPKNWETVVAFKIQSY
jgi:UDP-N-acetylmuramate dehydrogenase